MPGLVSDMEYACVDTGSVCMCVLLCRSLVTVILGAVMMFLTSWKLALLTCATLPFMLLQFRAFAREGLPDGFLLCCLQCSAVYTCGK